MDGVSTGGRELTPEEVLLRNAILALRSYYQALSAVVPALGAVVASDWCGEDDGIQLSQALEGVGDAVMVLLDRLAMVAGRQVVARVVASELAETVATAGTAATAMADLPPEMADRVRDTMRR
jgi:hypothetical protein